MDGQISKHGLASWLDDLGTLLNIFELLDAGALGRVQGPLSRWELVERPRLWLWSASIQFLCWAYKGVTFWGSQVAAWLSGVEPGWGCGGMLQPGHYQPYLPGPGENGG